MAIRGNHVWLSVSCTYTSYCVGCYLRGRNTVEFHSIAEVFDHVQEHLAAGHHVKPSKLQRIHELLNYKPAQAYLDQCSLGLNTSPE